VKWGALQADKEGGSKGMVKDTIKEVGISREKVENELDRKKRDLMSVHSLEFLSLASSQMVRSAVQHQAGY
jgi:hypothetical protein